MSGVSCQVSVFMDPMSGAIKGKGARAQRRNRRVFDLCILASLRCKSSGEPGTRLSITPSRPVHRCYRLTPRSHLCDPFDGVALPDSFGSRAMEGSNLRRSLILALICTMLSSLAVTAQTRRPRAKRRHRVHVTRSTAKRTIGPVTIRPVTPYAEKEQAEIRAGRNRIASQIRALTQFLYVFGGVSKGIENAELANRNREDSSVALSVEQIAQNKGKITDSIRNVRAGLETLESSFRFNPALQSYYPSLAGLTKLGQTAESLAASGNFDQAGRSLITAVSKLADALAAFR